MQVILTNDVVGLGDIGESVNVKPGYARNFLIPRGLAIESGSRSAGAISHKMRQIEAKKRRLKGGAEELAKALGGITVELALRVGSGGKVFGSISSRDIAAALTAQGHEIDRRRILLEEPIKKTGAHTVKVKLHPEVVTHVTVQVKQIEATKEEEERAAQEVKGQLEEATAARDEKEEADEPEGETEKAPEKPKGKKSEKKK